MSTQTFKDFSKRAGSTPVCCMEIMQDGGNQFSYSTYNDWITFLQGTYTTPGVSASDWSESLIFTPDGQITIAEQLRARAQFSATGVPECWQMTGAGPYTVNNQNYLWGLNPQQFVGPGFGTMSYDAILVLNQPNPLALNTVQITCKPTLTYVAQKSAIMTSGTTQYYNVFIPLNLKCKNLICSGTQIGNSSLTNILSEAEVVLSSQYATTLTNYDIVGIDGKTYTVMTIVFPETTFTHDMQGNTFYNSNQLGVSYCVFNRNQGDGTCFDASKYQEFNLYAVGGPSFPAANCFNDYLWGSDTSDYYHYDRAPAVPLTAPTWSNIQYYAAGALVIYNGLEYIRTSGSSSTSSTPDLQPVLWTPTGRNYNANIQKMGVYGQAMGDVLTSINDVQATTDFNSITIDFGSVPTTSPLLHLLRETPANTYSHVTALGSNDNTAWAPVYSNNVLVPSLYLDDGNTIVAYRYYKFSIEFWTGDAFFRPAIKSLMLSIGGLDYVSTNEGVPMQTAKPYLVGDSISLISSKISMDQPASISELSMQIYDRPWMSNMLSTGKLKNKRISAKIGYTDLPYGDYSKFFSGYIYDIAYQQASGCYNVKVRDWFKKFQNLTLPIQTADGSGNNTTAPFIITGNIIDCIYNLMSTGGVPSSILDPTSFTNTRNTYYVGSFWNMYQSVTSPTAILDLINDLCVLAGVFVYMSPDGLVRCRTYDPTQTPTFTLDANKVMFKDVQFNLSELFPTIIVHYGPVNTTKDSSNPQDYNFHIISGDSAAATEFGETQSKSVFVKQTINTNTHFSQDSYPINAVGVGCPGGNLITRMDSWFSSPKATVQVQQVPTDKMDIQLGDLVYVNNLKMPETTDAWVSTTAYMKYNRVLWTDNMVYECNNTAGSTGNSPGTSPTYWKNTGIHATGLTMNKKFMVMGWGYQYKDCSLQFDLMEI